MQKLKEPKVWKNFDEQLDILIKRGLIVNDEKQALGYLKSIGYYRLSGYLYSFRQIDPHHSDRRLDDFIMGSRFEDVKNLYLFDKKLRQFALDALEHIEIALRVNIAHLLGKRSATAHLDTQYFDISFDHQAWVEKYDALLKRERKTAFVKHHLTHYTDLPIWAGCEVWDFGTMSMLFKGMLDKDKMHIAKMYHLIDGKHLQTHLHAFNFIRNVSAHHSRLWNRAIIFQANLKGLLEPQWRQLSAKQAFVYFCLMKRMLDIICPKSMWGNRFLDLLDEFPQVENQAVSLQQMGFTIDISCWKLWNR